MPAVSIVIPTYRRNAKLARALERLERQDSGAERFEVVVVQDHKDEDEATLETTIGARPFRVLRLRAARPGASAARNEGWRAATAPLILFLDDDVLGDPGLVREHLATHAADPDPRTGVLGDVRWAAELKVTPFMRWLERGIQFDYPAIAGEDAGWGRFYTANASVKRELLETVGGFDEAGLPFGYEDLDLARRMHDEGLRLIYNRRAGAEHLHAMRIEEWETRIARIARAEHSFVRKHPDVEPYFLGQLAPYERFEPRARAARLAALVGPRTPLVGERIWRSLDIGYRARLAPFFMAAWRAAEAEAQAGARPAP